MFNREYQRRAAKQALREIGAELARDENSGFYRPAWRPDPRPPKKKRVGESEQLNLNFNGDQPLRDVFPEAYEPDP